MSTLDVLHQLKQIAQHNHHRYLVRLAGPLSWSEPLVEALVEAKSALFIGTFRGRDNIAAEQARHQLGGEHEWIIFNAWDGLHPDAFGACSGTLKGGGLLLLLTPEDQQWPHKGDPDQRRYVSLASQQSSCHWHFITRFCRIIAADPYSFCITPAGLPISLPIRLTVQKQPDIEDARCLTTDQQGVLNNLVRQLPKRNAGPFVLTAHRGRGKSATLGMVAADLMCQGVCRHILVTAPSFFAAACLFDHAAKTLGLASGHTLCTPSGASLSFISPDTLLQQRPGTDLLLVDEAAAIPLPLLNQMLKQYQPIVFATTQHGYEGSGRGFTLKFTQTLSNIFPSWRALQLKQPIRWQVDDPLEQLTFRLLSLDAEPRDPPVIEGTQCLSLRHITALELTQDEPLLRELFALLVTAHYQTKPSDLRQILDSPNCGLWALFDAKNPVAIALLTQEGPIEPALTQAIWLGKRRLRGQILPQTLLTHAGWLEASDFRFARIMRIAVHPKLQQQGLGSALLTKMIHRVQPHYDFLGASFGVTSELLDFWHKNQFATVRLGVQRDSASGCHATVLLKALSPNARKILPKWQALWQESWLPQLSHEFNALEPALLKRLLLPSAHVPTQSQWLDCLSFAYGHRQIQHLRLSLQRVFLYCIQSHSDHEDDPLVIAHLLQRKPWSELTSMNLSGRKQGEHRLRLRYRSLLERYLPGEYHGLLTQLKGIAKQTTTDGE